MPTLSFNKKRLIVAIALLPCLLCVVNYFLDLQIFGQFAKQALIASFIVLFLVMRYLGPTLREIEEYRDAKRSGKRL